MLRRMEKAMRRMPRLEREVFLAHRLDNMPYEEIASRTGLAIKDVERCIARVLCALDRASAVDRSEEHTSELQSIMRSSYAVFCLKKKTHHKGTYDTNI